MKTKNPKLNSEIRRKVLISIIIAGCVIIASAGVYFGVTVYSQIKDFDINNLTTTTTSKQVDENGKSYYTYGSNQGKYTSYNALPEVFVDALVSAEDSRFFIHNGFDMPRIVKAMLSNLKAGGIAAGGSTITQQLIKKTYYPNEEKTIQRKLGEIILAIQASQQTTKQKVLELYVNKIYFGRSTNTVGIYAASKYYFNKTPSQLTLPEAALLAGAVNSPVYYDAFNNLTKAQNRRNIILGLMYQHGYITKSEYETAKATKVANYLNSKPLTQSKKYASYVDRVSREVKQLTGYDPNKTNMTIYTYLDTELQQSLDNIAAGKTYTFPDRFMQMGGVVQEAKTGRIIGLMSARDFKAGNYSYAFSDRHQPGSSIKPVLDYATAFEYLYWSTGHIADDTRYSSGGWTPKNWDRQYHGRVTLYEALGKSWNAAAIHTLADVYKKVGKTKLVNWLKNLGYNMSDESFSLAYGIGGWSHGTTPLQMAAAYAAISNGGVYIQPHTIKKVVINTTGETINVDQELRNDSRQAMSKATAFMLRNIMTTYVKQYSDYSDFDIGDEIGAKTGTTNHDGSIAGIPANKSKDNWLCAYSPDYAWSFWDGYSYNDQVNHKMYISGTNQAKIVAAKVAKILNTRKMKNSYETPNTVVQAKMIRGVYPYQSPTSSTPASSITTAWFVKGHTPSGSDTSSTTTSTDSLNALSSFNASVTSDNKIRVIFAAYDPSSDVASGNVVYRVQVFKGSTSVYSQSLTTSSATLNFTPEANTTYRVIGYYSLASGAKTSNRISRSVTTNNKTTQDATYTVSSAGSRITNGATINGSTIYVNTSGDAASRLTISCGGTTRTVNAGSGASFSVEAGRSYTVTVTQTNSDGTTKSLDSFSFSVAASNEDNNDNEDTANTNQDNQDNTDETEEFTE